jgi:hypothetical protein
MNGTRSNPITPTEKIPPADKDAIMCPICGQETVREKCKVICRSEQCRGRVIYNCSEF